MRNRSKMPRRQARRDFSRNASMTNKRNLSKDRVMRGGYRL